MLSATDSLEMAYWNIVMRILKYTMGSWEIN